jgi:hypothetical protein
MNRQIQGLQARLSQAENNITSHFYATSMLVQSLSANPLTSGSAAVVAGIYNLIPNGFDLMQKLIAHVSPIDFKALMMINAGDLIAGMSAELDGLVSVVVSNVESQIEMVAAQVVAAGDALATATLDMTTAVAGGIQSEIDAAGATLQQAGDLLDSLNAKHDHLLNLHMTSVNFLTSQADVSKCKSVNLKITS